MVARACNPGTQEPDQGQNGLYQILDKLANSIPRKGKKILLPLYWPTVSKCNSYPGAMKFQRVFFLTWTEAI